MSRRFEPAAHNLPSLIICPGDEDHVALTHSLTRNPHARKSIKNALTLLLSFGLILTQCTFLFRSVAIAQDKPDEIKGQIRKTLPFTALPDPAEVLSKDKAKKADLPPPPIVPSTECGYRDALCQMKKNGKVGSNAAPANNPTEQKVAPNEVQKSSGFLSNFKKKVSGLFAGASISSLMNPDIKANSFASPLITHNSSLITSPAPPPPPPAFGSLNEAKVDPHTRIGTGGEDLFSGNYNWSLPLVSLPGRAGLDLNISLSYNSLVWVRHGSTMEFEPDYYQSLTPGFRLGFPTLENYYSYDGKYAYLITLPSGRRVPMISVGRTSSTVNKYEAVDGSNLYLTVGGSAGIILYAPDGTQFIYTNPLPYANPAVCTQIKDNNGNKITMTYDDFGITTITDTLGRVINFNYDNLYHLQTITQNWNGFTHTWAQFDYANKTINPNFAGLTVYGPANGSQIPVLDRVITSDGARHTFVYNSWGIVDDIYTYGQADNQRAALDYVFPDTSVPQTDCPRFSQRNDGIYGWWGQWNTAGNGFGWEASAFNFDASETFGAVTTPDGIVHKENFGTTGSTRGLSTGMETIVGGIKKKWTTAAWASDSANKPLRPRVTETNIYDDVNGNGTYQAGVDNRKRTTIDYITIATQSMLTQSVKVPSQINEFAADATTVLRYSQTDYMNEPYYNARRIIGLPTEQRLYDGNNVLQSKVGYLYDSTIYYAHATVPSQHDNINYHDGLYVRGNLTNVRRYDVTSSAYTETQTDYYVTGNPSATRDALNHETKITYADAFATYADDAANTATPVTPTVATFAYPTDIEDAEHYHSKLKYWYATGANTRAENPLGAVSLNIYEMQYFGRPIKSKNTVNGAYTRYEYSTDHNWFRTWTTVNSLTEEAVNLQILDGANRARVSVADHPGSVGGLALSYKVFDLMGRVVEWSNPTEINNQPTCGQIINGVQQPACWIAFGDDVAGFNYSRQEYDWKGRPTITYNQDYNVNTNPNSKRTVSYEGCGCAGTQSATATDEMGRMQKAYSDILGRTFKTEIYNGSSVYSSAQNSFNGRDQVINTTEYAGAVGSATSQSTLLTYDGYGRLQTRKRPQETSPTTYSYNNNNQVVSSIDARGASGTLVYNLRGLMTQASYTVPSGVATTPTVNFQYDAAGNRTQMDDGPGLVTYQYNSLSQLTQETRTFDMISGQIFPISYEYNLGGQIKKITDHTNVSINYAYDKTGRTTDITGSSFAGITNYATGKTYRAWGVPKAVSYGSGFNGSAKYNGRLQVTQFDIPTVIGGTYSYNLDGQLNTFTPSTPLSN